MSPPVRWEQINAEGPVSPSALLGRFFLLTPCPPRARWEVIDGELFQYWADDPATCAFPDDGRLTVCDE